MTLAVGQQRPLRIRRIGKTHVVVLPAQAAEVVDLRLVRRQVAILRQQIQSKERELERDRSRLSDLASTLARAEALPIERVEDDPDVDPPEPAAPSAPAPIPQETPAAAE